MYRRWTHNLWTGFALFFYLVLLIRLFTIQILNNDRYKQSAIGQSTRTITLYPKRGDIYDRNFDLLAFDINQYSFGVNPEQLNNKRLVAEKFAQITGNNVSYYLNQLKKDEFVWLARGVDQKTSNRLSFKKKNPVAKIKDIGRYYPYQKVAAHVLGFTNIDNVGLAGLEKSYNELLEGEPGYKIIHVDAHQNPVPLIDDPRKAPVNGKNIITTLNIDYQLIAEEELRRGIESTHAKSGMVIMMEPYSGEILAMVSCPSFNPNHFESYSQSERRNRGLIDPYEPGSTFKLVTVAAALQEGLVLPPDPIYCENGKKMFPGGWIRDHKKYKTLTFRKVFINSSNIGIAKVAQKIGKQRIYQYGRAFGFGSISSVDLPGEDEGKFTNAAKWDRSDAVRIPIGYGVLTTGLQLVNAYAAVANGGYLMKPKIVKAVLSDDPQNIIQETQKDTIRRVLTNETVIQLKSFMKAVVEDGTGENAAIDGLPIAGKTGTTKKYDPALKAYSDRKYIASFMGFTPVEHPKLVCLVVVDEPEYPNYYGGLAAAPIFRNIVRRILGTPTKPEEDIGAAISLASDMTKITVPDVTEMNIYQAKTILEDYQFQVRTKGNGGYVAAQQPVQGTLLEPREVVQLILDDNLAEQEKSSKVPDVRGKSIREAIAILIQAGFDPKPHGSGFVISQDPPPNSKPELRECRIVCRPLSS